MSLQTMNENPVTSAFHAVFPPVSKIGLPPPESAEQRPASWKSLNMAPGYMSAPKDFRQYRELIQNWRDRCIEMAEECTKQSWQSVVDFIADYDKGIFALICRFGGQSACLGHIAVRKQSGDRPYTVELVNHDTVLNSKVLTLGYSKKASASSAGQFGEGMKVEINAFVANGANVRILTGYYGWTFGYMTVGGINSGEELCARVDQISPSPDTTIVVENGQELDFDKFLFLQESYWSYRRKLCEGVELDVEVLLDPKWTGKVYCQGIHIMDENSLSTIGLNFLGSTQDKRLQMGRDRNSVRLPHIIDQLPRSIEQLYNCETKHRDRTRIFEDRNSVPRSRVIVQRLLDEMSSDGYNPLVNRLRTESGHKTFFNILLEVTQVRYNGLVDDPQEDPRRNVPVVKDSKDAEQLYYLQFPRVFVEEGLLNLLKKAPSFLTVDEAWEQKKQDLLALPDWDHGTDQESKYIEWTLRANACQYFQLQSEQIMFKNLPDTKESRSINQIVFPYTAADGVKYYIVNGTFLLTRPFSERVHRRQWEKESLSCTAGGGSCGCLTTAFLTALIDAIAGKDSSKKQTWNKLLLREGMAAIGRAPSNPSNIIAAENPPTAGAATSSEKKRRTPSKPTTSHSAASSSAASNQQTVFEDNRGGQISREPLRPDKLLKQCLGSLRDVNPEAVVLNSPCPPTRTITLRDGCDELVKLDSRYIGSQKIQVREGLETPNLFPEQVVEFRKLILELLVYVFKMDGQKATTCFNIFWDNTQSTIAFNKGQGELAFNLYYYDPSSSWRKAYQYWTITIAHELAHNVAKGHDKEHEYAEELILFEVMDSLFQFLNNQGSTL